METEQNIEHVEGDVINGESPEPQEVPQGDSPASPDAPAEPAEDPQAE